MFVLVDAQALLHVGQQVGVEIGVQSKVVSLLPTAVEDTIFNLVPEFGQLR